MADVRVRNEGSVVLFMPLTDNARDWVEEHVHLEGWQWMGSSFAVDHRFAGDLASGMEQYGLEVE